MSAPDEDEDKQYDPSQKKLDDARKKGEIARSADLHTAGAYAGFLLILLTVGPAALVGVADMLMVLLGQSAALSAQVFAGGGSPVFGGVILTVAAGAGVWFAAPAIMAILSILGQRAFTVAPSKIAPKLSRISPMEGVKNKLGRQGLFEFAKSATKLVIYSIALGWFLVAQVESIIGSLRLSPRQILVVLGELLAGLMALVLLIALILGGVDFLWQRANHLRKNRMSRKELMDELKQSEGDPMMKQQRRQRGQEIAMNRMLADVPKADVVIVNPTHFAVALQWDRSRAAPVCLAKGVDETAARIREMGMEHGVPIHSDPPTARALYAEVEIGQEILPDHYKAVAAAIRFAEAIRQKARRR